MKLLCNVCGLKEATVLCCADEAALCWLCDQKVHTDNILVSQRQRVPLSISHSGMPNCDICQERIGYFFCLDDKALLCRKCDVAVHTSNSLMSTHQRFLLTGVKVSLEATEPSPSPTSGKTHNINKNSEPEFSLPNITTSLSSAHQLSKNLTAETIVGGDFSSSIFPFTGGSSKGIVYQLD